MDELINKLVDARIALKAVVDERPNASASRIADAEKVAEDAFNALKDSLKPAEVETAVTEEPVKEEVPAEVAPEAPVEEPKEEVKEETTEEPGV